MLYVHPGAGCVSESNGLTFLLVLHSIMLWSIVVLCLVGHLTCLLRLVNGSRCSYFGWLKIEGKKWGNLEYGTSSVEQLMTDKDRDCVLFLRKVMLTWRGGGCFLHFTIAILDTQCKGQLLFIFNPSSNDIRWRQVALNLKHTTIFHRI